MLRGDEVGALLGSHIVGRGVRTGDVFACSIVSSRLLAAIAAAAGIRHEETLTGFKWISRVAGLRYGYEEALGYCVAPSPRQGQGRRQRRAAARRAGGDPQGAGPPSHRRARRPRHRPRRARDRLVLGARLGPEPDRGGHARASRPAADLGGGSRSRAWTTSRPVMADSRPPRACATTSPTSRGSSSVRVGPNRRSRSISRSSRPVPLRGDLVAARAAADRLAAIRAEFERLTALP